MHAAGPVHDTPLRTLSNGPLGLGTMDQVDPFQDSTSVWSAVPSLDRPTAVHAAGPVHDTALRKDARGVGARDDGPG